MGPQGESAMKSEHWKAYDIIAAAKRGQTVEERNLNEACTLLGFEGRRGWEGLGRPLPAPGDVLAWERGYEGFEKMRGEVFLKQAA